MRLTAERVVSQSSSQHGPSTSLGLPVYRENPGRVSGSKDGARRKINISYRKNLFLTTVSFDYNHVYVR